MRQYLSILVDCVKQEILKVKRLHRIADGHLCWHRIDQNIYLAFVLVNIINSLSSTILFLQYCFSLYFWCFMSKLSSIVPAF